MSEESLKKMIVDEQAAVPDLFDFKMTSKIMDLKSSDREILSRIPIREMVLNYKSYPFYATQAIYLMATSVSLYVAGQFSRDEVCELLMALKADPLVDVRTFWLADRFLALFRK